MFTRLHELSLTDTDIICEAYPRKDFDYTNYDVDPRPDVLVLGSYRHPNTENDLIAGINLNYLSHGQLVKLRKNLKNIFPKKNLKNRYWRIKRLMPDIAHAYRTYDKDFVHRVHSGDLDDYVSRSAEGGKRVGSSDKAKARKSDDEKDLKQKIEEPPKDVESQDDEIDTGRRAWQHRRQMYDPETGKRNTPERKDASGFDDAKREKRNRYRTQRRKLKDLDRRDEIERLAKDLQDTEKPEDEWPSQSDLGSEQYESYQHMPEIGYVWGSPEDYVNYHDPLAFIAERNDGSILENSIGKKILAAYDVIGNRLIVDLGSDHNTMLHEANWGYTRSILFEVDEQDVVVTHEYCPSHDIERAVTAFQGSIIPLLMAESAT